MILSFRVVDSNFDYDQGRFRGYVKGSPMPVDGCNREHSIEMLKTIKDSFKYKPDIIIKKNTPLVLIIELKEGN